MNTSGNIIVLGMFDGVHIGHAKLFSIAKELKADTASSIIAYTFENHPMEVIKGTKPDLILTNSERASKILAKSADDIVMDKFDEAICNMDEQTFAAQIKARFNALHVVVGFNYTFGKSGSGTPEKLKAYGEKYGYEVHIAQPVLYNDKPVSSSRIRKAIEQGKMLEANAMLGYNYTMSGVVERCRQVGRSIGYPTANIRNTDKKPLPLFGVYATYTHIGSRTFNSVTNVGTNPTFGEMAVSIETHIFDFDEDIYDVPITVEFLDFVRPQRRFSGIDELKFQIAKDSETVISLQADLICASKC